MSCDRCKDIHKAQAEGKTQKECGCNCHNIFYAGITSTTAGNTLSVTGNDVLFTANMDTGTCDATTTFTFTDRGECNCDGSGLHNCNCLSMSVHVSDGWCNG